MVFTLMMVAMALGMLIGCGCRALLCPLADPSAPLPPPEACTEGCERCALAAAPLTAKRGNNLHI